MDKQLSSSEIGNLWMTFQQKTMLARLLEHFLANKQNEEVHNLVQTYYEHEINFINELTELFKRENIVVPVGYVENDVKPSTKPLYDQYFDALFLRVMMKLTIGFNALNVSMSYRQDITQLYKRFLDVSQNTYNDSTQFLLKDEKRPLNAIELSLLYQGIETNVLGFQLLKGFEQVTEDKEVKKYFERGKDLAKQIIDTFSEILLKSDIQPPIVAWGNPTLSTESPYSEKLMMYLTNLLSSFGLTSNALGTSFSLRSDLPAKMTLIAKDIFDYAKDGGQLMIKNGWMEEPPQSLKSTK
jgi:hypothetical protein